jgi:hypothetical protein
MAAVASCEGFMLAAAAVAGAGAWWRGRGAGGLDQLGCLAATKGIGCGA